MWIALQSDQWESTSVCPMRKHFSLTNEKVLQSEKCGSTLSWPLRKHFNLPNVETLKSDKREKPQPDQWGNISFGPMWRHLKVPPSQNGSAREWYHWIGLEKDINRYRGVWFFVFDLEYLIRVQSSEMLHAKMNPTSYLFRSRFACAQTTIFFADPCSKNTADTSIVLWITARE
jgi:hypothetical protein